MTPIGSSGDFSQKTSLHQLHLSLSETTILRTIFSFLPKEDFLNCRLVCGSWKYASYTRYNETIHGKYKTMSMSKSQSSNDYNSREGSSFYRIMLEPIVDQIVSCLPTKEMQLQSRLISQIFNYIVKQKVSFTPILNDCTSKAVLSTDKDLNVFQLKVKDLYTMLPTKEGNLKLDCNFNPLRVRSILFYEGVPTKNKIILLQTFIRITELKYLGSSSFVYFQDDSYFQYLHTLHIKADASNDMGGNLTDFLNKARFPVLQNISIDFYFRMDFSIYFAAHNFIGNHYKTLKDVVLKFCSKYDYHPPESVDGIPVTYTPQLVKQLSQLINITFNQLQLNSLSMEFLPFEGTSLFIIGFALAESQKGLKILRLYKEYTYTRSELLPLNTILQNNARTLVHINIPHPYVFNCACIQNCQVLESLQIGEVMYSSRYVMMFSDSDMLNIMCLPRLLTFSKFKVSIRLTHDQLEWIIAHHQLTDFYFNGHQADRYTSEDIQHILCVQTKLEHLGFNCDMAREEYDLTAKYCRDNEGVVYTESVYGEEEFYVALGESRGKFQITIDRKVFNQLYSHPNPN